MSRRNIGFAAAGAAAALVFGFLYFQSAEVNIAREQARIATATSTALLAGGCFWCVESDFEKLHGVIAAVSGYAPLSGELSPPAE